MTNPVVKPVVRQAVLGDVPQIQAMFAEFVRSTQYARYVGNNPEHSAATIAQVIEMEDGTVFVVDTGTELIGMFGIVICVQPWSGERVAVEAFWWLNPARRGYGVFLLRRAERWAKAHGATRLSMMAPVDKPRVGEIYRALGYEAVEVTYQKDLA